MPLDPRDVTEEDLEQVERLCRIEPPACASKKYPMAHSVGFAVWPFGVRMVEEIRRRRLEDSVGRGIPPEVEHAGSEG